MAITFFGVTSAPSDNGAQAGPTVTLPPVASMQAGDLCLVFAERRQNDSASSVELDYTNQGGQRWSTYTDNDPDNGGTPANLYLKAFSCIFNGTWSGDLIFRTATGPDDSASALAMSLVMLVFRPTSTSKFWVPCVWVRANNFAASNPATITAITTAAQHGSNSHVAIGAWAVARASTFSNFSGTNWSQSGLGAQYRNTTGSDLSMAFAYQIQSSSGTTNNVSLDQDVATAGCSMILAFTEIDLPSGGTGGTLAFVQSEISGSNESQPSATVTLGAGVTSGNSIAGKLHFENFDAVDSTAQPEFPMTDNQGNEMVVVQCVDYKQLNQVGMTFYRPNITNAPTTFTLNFTVDVIATGMVVHEINGGVDLHAYSGTWGFPSYKAEWDPLSAGSVTTTKPCYIFGSAFLPGDAIDTPLFDFTAWSGTKREEIGNDSPFLNTFGSADLVQGAAGAIDVRESSTSSAATALMMLALSATANESRPMFRGG